MPKDFLGWLRIADTVALAMVAIRLVWSGLFRNYPALTAHAIFETLLAGLSFAIPLGSLTYAWAFVGISPIRWALWVGIVWGLLKASLKDHPAIMTASRWALGAALVLALIPVALTINLDFSHVGPNIRVLPLVIFAERTVTAALAFVVLALCGFLAWFMVPTSRNCAYICMGFGLVFATRSAAYSLRNALGPQVMPTLNWTMLVVSTGVFLAWAIVLTREGEEPTAFVGPRRAPSDPADSIRALSDLSDHLRPKAERERGDPAQ